MKIGVQNEYVFSERETDPEKIDAGFRTLAKAGFDAVDFGLFSWADARGAAPEEWPILTLSETELRAFFRPFKEAAARHGVSIGQMHAPFPTQIGEPAKDAALIRVMERSVHIAAYLGCPYVVVHPAKPASEHGDARTPDADTVWEQNRALYEPLIPVCRETGVVVCLENMFSYDGRKIYTSVCADAGQAVRFIDRLNEMAGARCFAFCLDVGHLILLGLDPYRTIVTLGDRLAVLHLHDNDGVMDIHREPYCAGGVTNWDNVLEGLRAIDYRGNLSFETLNALALLPPEVRPAMLHYIASVGRLWAARLGQG